MKPIPIWVSIASLLVSACGTAGERYQHAVVSAIDGKTCFALDPLSAGRKSRPLLSSIRVDERVEGVARTIWEIEFLDQQDVELVPGDCVPYVGGEPDPPPALRPGSAYSVTILADVDAGGRFTARWYSAHFCMLETAQGLVPLQVEAGGRSDAPGWAACGTGVRW